jgi:hypothetical protein
MNDVVREFFVAAREDYLDMLANQSPVAGPRFNAPALPQI